MKYDINTFFEWPISAKAVVIAVVCLIVFFMGYLWDIAPLKGQLVSKKQEEQDLKSQFEMVFAKQISIQNQVSQFPKLKDKLSEWQKKFVQPTGLPGLLNEILKIGESNQLQFDLFSPGQPVKEGDYFKVPIKVVIAGNYHLIASFLSQIANLPTMVVIGDFNITRVDAQPKPEDDHAVADLLKVELILNIYYLAEKAVS